MKYVSHSLLALALQLLVFVCFGNWWTGAALATAAYLMREATQAEYRWIERFGSGRRANMPWWAPFDPRVWVLKDWAGWLLPLTLTVLVAAVAGLN